MEWNVLGVFAISSLVEFLWHCYHLVDILLDLESWSTTIVLDRQQIVEDIWSSIKFYVLLCAWNLLVSICTLFLSLSWYFSCQCIGTNKSGTNMWGLGWWEILLVIIVNHTGYSAIVFSRKYPRLFLQLRLKFPSDR